MMFTAALAAAFLCQVAYVHDGDTLRCTDGTRVRLQAVDAPELGRCNGRRGRVCVPGDGQAARRVLVRLAEGRTLRCVRTGTSYNRVTAWCSADGVDLSCALVQNGAAVRVARYGGNRVCAGRRSPG
jgi:endonuclease YncB( thermonuclease family)